MHKFILPPEEPILSTSLVLDSGDTDVNNPCLALGSPQSRAEGAGNAPLGEGYPKSSLPPTPLFPGCGFLSYTPAPK